MKNTVEKQWKEMTAAERRVALAKDVIAQIEAKKFLAKSNIFVRITKELPSFSELREQLPKVKCQVCAKGALFLAHVKLFNKCKVGSSGRLHIQDSEVKSRLGKIFSKLQMDMIEVAFEKRGFSHTSESLIKERRYAQRPLLTEKGTVCVEFGKKFRSVETRLVAIMENVIENKGIFKP